MPSHENKSGPSIAALTKRLSETPPDFLLSGIESAEIYLALLNDLRAHFGIDVQAQADIYAEIGSDSEERQKLQFVAIWLLFEPGFADCTIDDAKLLRLIHEHLSELAEHNTAQRYITEPDRREEFARTVLARLDLIPAGETASEARDRLVSVSTAERQRLLQQSRAAEQRAREIREALARKAAEQSADKWTRE